MAAISILTTAVARAAPEDTPAGLGLDVVSYCLELTPDVANKTLSGRELIELRATEDGLKRLVFSGNVLTIDSATANGVPVTVDSTRDRLAVVLPRSLVRGRTVRLDLAFHGRPVRGFAGSGTMLYTSYFASDWMVCVQDAFGDKAGFTLDLAVPKGMDGFSIGRMMRRRGVRDREVQRWRAPRPYPAYLYGFAIGRFARARARTGSAALTYLSDVATPAALDRRFANTPAMVRFLAAKAGLALPGAEYIQRLVAGDEAQEGATYAVLGEDEVPPSPGDPDEDWAIVHELAHQWWGNLVTCASLRDFWLNEGIATFMTAAWKEHRYGRAANDAELDVARRRLDRARALGFDEPLAWAGRYPSLAVRRAIQYNKGALFMARLRTVLGDAAFSSALRRYTRAHAGGTVTSIDLERAMEAASVRDLRSIFAEWIGLNTDPRR